MAKDGAVGAAEAADAGDGGWGADRSNAAAISAILERIGLSADREPFDGLDVRANIIPVIRKWLRGMNDGELQRIAGWDLSEGLPDIDTNLVRAINNLRDNAPSIDLRDMMRSLYKLQVKIILLRCDQLARGIPPGINVGLVEDLAQALTRKVKALDEIMDAKFVQQIPGSVHVGGGAAYKAKKYKYKYLRAKNAI